jgi:hypothetical protein
MVQRLTDKFTEAFQTLVSAVQTYTRANQGLPMIMAEALSVPAASTQSLTITCTTDVYVNNIQTNVTSAAFALVNDARVTRIQVAGFLLYEDQGTQTPFFYDTTGGRAGYEGAENFKGYATPFKLRQGDVITVTCQNTDAANAAILSVKVDAYRTTQARPG